MNLVVLTPEKEIYNGTIKSVKVPGSNGQFEILAGHASIVSSLMGGEVRIIGESGEKQTMTIEKGFVEVLNNEVALLVTGVE
jgi:F-type H+-transporting ATPase subunit epsilon